MRMYQQTSFGARQIAVTIISILAALPVTAYGQVTRLHGNVPLAAIGAAPVGYADPKMMLSLEIRFAVRNRAELDRLLAAQQDPGSPQYHHWLSGKEYSRRFGPTDQQFADVTNWLKSQGFTITGGSPRDGVIRFQGSVAAVEHEFDTRINLFGNGASFGNSTEPAIPAQFKDVIAAINGLDNMHAAVPGSRHFSRPSTPVPGRGSRLESPLTIVSSLHGGSDRAPVELLAQAGEPSPGVIVNGTGPSFGPYDFYTFYDETPLKNQNITGALDCIAVIGNSDFSLTPVTAFNNQFGLPASNITRVLADGTNPGINSAESEALLDLEWSHAVAPGAATKYFLGDDAHSSVNGSIVDGLRAAVRDNTCAVVSISFSLCGGSRTFYTSTVDSIAKRAAAQGQTIFVASGDWGAAGLVLDPTSNQCVPGTSRNVNELASDPIITSVGGTSFAPTFDGSGNDVGYALNGERVWDDPNDGISQGGATGGGTSAFFSKPAFQTGPGVPTGARRHQPDVALIASPNFPGSFIFDDGGGGTPLLTIIGGTSIATPMWAGIAKLLQQESGGRLGTINPRVYQLAAAGQAQAGFHDVVTGNNGFNGVQGFSAGPGYDLATGWGTVDIATFISAFTASPVPVALKVSPSIVRFGAVPFGSSSNPKKVTLTNPNKRRIPITLQAFETTKDFQTGATTCPQILPAGGKCFVFVLFAPSGVGPELGTLMILDNAKNAPQTISLKGRGK